jgi:nucleoside-diphosphate-sugar epimerase
MAYSIFGGHGFVGSEVMKLLDKTSEEDHIRVSRNQISPLPRDEVLYLISTTDNYNVLSNPYIDIDTNLTHLMRVLDSCRQSKTSVFNFVSSWFVYGDQENYPVKEDAPCNPKGFYSITKKCAEDLVISYCKTFKMDYRIFRLGNVIGTGDGGVSAKKNALQYLINQMKDNKDINLYNGGRFFRDYVHVEDVARALLFLMKKSPVNDIYNIGGSDDMQEFIDIMNHAKEMLGSTSRFNAVKPSEFHDIVQTKDMVLDSFKLIELGFVYKHEMVGTLGELCKKN